MSWDKFGSPYDPKHKGKYRLSSETVSIRDWALESGQMPKAEDLRAQIQANFEDSYLRRFAEIFGVEEKYISREHNAQSDVPPASLTAAREKVQQWIVPAPTQSFGDIIGNEEALALLRDAIEAPVKHKALYAEYGLKMPKGALLSGPPGCGKTMFARAAAAEMKRLYGAATEFISLAGTELQSGWVGQTEQRIKAIFTFAREYRAFRGHPLLVFIDEAEAILPDRTGRRRRVESWEENQVATFLAEMDGMQESGAFVLLATNRPTVIDQAVLRDGRCDFKITVERPTPAAIESIVRKNFDGAPIAEGIKLEDLVFAAVESLFDPHKIILAAHLLRLQLGGEEEPKVEHSEKHFLLEHIVSGAMAASIPGRAKRLAFTRDKADGVARGITVDDVVQAVKVIFEENRGLDHAFALDEFKREFLSNPGGGGRRHERTA